MTRTKSNAVSPHLEPLISPPHAVPPRCTPLQRKRYLVFRVFYLSKMSRWNSFDARARAHGASPNLPALRITHFNSPRALEPHAAYRYPLTLQIGLVEFRLWRCLSSEIHKTRQHTIFGKVPAHVSRSKVQPAALSVLRASRTNAHMSRDCSILILLEKQWRTTTRGPPKTNCPCQYGRYF